MKISLIHTVLLGATASLGSLIQREPQKSEDSAPSSDPEDPVLLLSKDESFHFELLYTLGNAAFGAGDINEVLAVAKDVKAGNFTDWLNRFEDLAKKTKKTAEDPNNAYDPVNVREAWFATANYYRQADFYNHENWSDPRISEFWDEQRSAFDKALAALPVPGERIQIPATTSEDKNFTIEAVWYTPANDKKKRPTLVIGNGYDAAQEDSYHYLVAPALERGWNVITYEGPGQPTVRRNDDIGFIPEWEKVLTPVIDELLLRKGCLVDRKKLTLVGISMGGYLAARAAAFEPRIKALVLNGGVFNIHDAYASQLPEPLKELFDDENKEEFDAAAMQLFGSPEVPTTVRWGLGHGLWAFKKKSPYDWFNSLKDYDLEKVVDKIKVPVLVIDSEFEGFFTGQPELVKEALGDKATYKKFKGVGGYHCQVGASHEWNRYQFSWLHKTLG